MVVSQRPRIFFGNSFFFVKAAGCTAACIGIWFRIERDFTTLIQRIEEADISITAAYMYLGANILISIGCIIAFVGLLGSYSITKENEKLLAVVCNQIWDNFATIFIILFNFFFKYSLLMFGVFGLYVACAVWGFVKMDYVNDNNINFKIFHLILII